MTGPDDELFETPADERPVALLEGDAAPTWQAFNAMQATKDRHFALLEAISDRRARYHIEPTRRDERLLAGLLADHDAEVRRFRAASDALRRASPDAHRRLFEYIALVNGALDARVGTH